MSYVQAVGAVVLLVVSVGAQETGIWEGSASTALGCNCKSSCYTTASIGCYAQSVCDVESDQCASGKAHPHSFTSSWFGRGFYDYCKFPRDITYEDKTAEQKLALLQAKIHEDPSSSTYHNLAAVLLKISGESVRLSFDAVSDVFPQEREKLIHSVGVVGAIRFESTEEHPYTGLFKEGADYGLIRFSSAKEPSKSGFTPGLAVKFLRDGRPSANFVAMPSLDGQTCDAPNFFELPFRNHIVATESFGLSLIVKKFWQASYCPQMVGLSDIATPGSTDAEFQAVFPYQLTLRSPLGELGINTVSVDCCSNPSNWMANFANLEPDTVLFDVLAQASPDAEEKKIGRILLTEKLTTSKFADEKLFFKHQHMEDDFKLHPEWLEDIDRKKEGRKKECGMNIAGVKAPTDAEGCTSPFDGKKPPMPKEDILV